jgi:hypothetical protein
MNLFAKILSHGFALTLVALLAVGLVYRGDLFPGLELPEFLSLDSGTVQSGNVSATADEKVQPSAVTGESPVEVPVVETSPVTADGISETISAETADLTHDTVTDIGQTDDGVPATDPLSPEAEVEKEGAVTEPAESSQPNGEERQETVATTGQTALPVEHTDVENELMHADPAETAAPALSADMQDEGGANAEAATDTAESGADSNADGLPVPTVDVDGNRVSPYQILASAREAFWLRDYVAAEQQYKELISQNPDNPDGYGELGNMYFSQGEWDKACAAYFDAGVHLLDQGMVSEAQQMVEVIRGLNGTQADELAQKINAVASSTQ